MLEPPRTNVEAKKVYKYSIAVEERKMLTSLLQLQSAVRSVFPVSTLKIQSDVNEIDFFTFPLLDQPLSPDEARRDALTFVGSVYEAVNELHHTFKLAHLDLRLGNICFGTGTRVAKLIDLDRANVVYQPYMISTLCSVH